MCQIVKAVGRRAGIPSEGNVGEFWNLQSGGSVSVSRNTYKVKCVHPDERSDTYLLHAGQRLVADEQARIEILEKYPDEVPTVEAPHPEEKVVPAELPV